MVNKINYHKNAIIYLLVFICFSIFIPSVYFNKNANSYNNQNKEKLTLETGAKKEYDKEDLPFERYDTTNYNIFNSNTVNSGNGLSQRYQII